MKATQKLVRALLMLLIAVGLTLVFSPAMAKPDGKGGGGGSQGHGKGDKAGMGGHGKGDKAAKGEGHGKGDKAGMGEGHGKGDKAGMGGHGKGDKAGMGGHGKGDKAAKGEARKERRRDKKKHAARNESKVAKEQRKHLKRKAKIDRLEALAVEQGNDNLGQKTEMLREKENRRHERKMKKLRARKGAGGDPGKGDAKEDETGDMADGGDADRPVRALPDLVPGTVPDKQPVEPTEGETKL